MCAVMTLTLRIDNFDTLDDGGPTWITLDQRGASIGRRASMDWVLPDPAKHISGHHFDIQYSDGAYWLRDVSTNGTYVQGSPHRIDGVQRLNGGERLVVGHYVIVVDLGGGAQVAPPPAAPATGAGWGTDHDDSDPWDLGPEPLQPVNPLPGPAANPHHFDEMAQDFVPLQRPSNPSPMPPAAAPVQQPGFGVGGADNVQHPPAGAATSAPLATPQMPTAAPPPVSAPAQPQSPPQPQHPPQSQPQSQPQTAPSSDARAVIEAFCRGAGVPPEAAEGVDVLVLVEALGRTARISVEEVMRMLQDRASVKQFTRGGERTMRSAIGNNPMKFLPDAEQAFSAMYLKPRDGFMAGAEGFENALGDIRRHQMAVFAALQPALAEVLSGLSPDDIENRETTAGNLLSGSKKGRHWEAFVSRWDEKASTGDHGMLDAFLRAFAKAYAEAASKQN